MAETTEKFDVRRALFLERLVRAWDKVPSMSIGSLVVASLEMEMPSDIAALAALDDVSLVERIEKYVLLRAKKDPR